VYFTDGSTAEHVLKVNRQIQENTNIDQYLLNKCAGYSDMSKKIIHIGAPYISKYNETISEIEGTFDYCYNDGVLGWGTSCRIPALKYAIANRNFFFISSLGGIHRIRDEQALSKFRDGEAPINLELKTRYLDGSEVQRYKFWRNVLFNFGDTSNYNAETYYSIDYKSLEYPLEIYTIVGAETYKGVSVQGSTQLLKILRETIAQRIFTISFRVSEHSVDTDMAIYKITCEGWLANTRLVSQKGGTRT
jgi:hypothetical protein